MRRARCRSASSHDSFRAFGQGRSISPLYSAAMKTVLAAAALAAALAAADGQPAGTYKTEAELTSVLKAPSERV